MPPLRVRVLEHNDIEIAGVSAVLAQFPERVELITDPHVAVEVTLYGIREGLGAHDEQLHHLARSTASGVVVALTWNRDPAAVAWALSCGAAAALSKLLSAAELVGGVEKHHRLSVGRAPRLPAAGLCHPALVELQLSPRELQTLELIAQGMGYRCSCPVHSRDPTMTSWSSAPGSVDNVTNREAGPGPDPLVRELAATVPAPEFRSRWPARSCT